MMTKEGLRSAEVIGMVQYSLLLLNEVKPMMMDWIAHGDDYWAWC
jgi:hypothetical protein